MSRRTAPGRLLRFHRRRQGRWRAGTLHEGNQVRLLPAGADFIRAVLDAVDGAHSTVHLEYYTLDDVRLDGRSLVDALERAAHRGVEVALIWDAIGSGGTPDALFRRLEQAGVRTMEYRSVNPLKRRFDIRMNDRDHRKITVVDGQTAFLGGANLSRVYETPAAVGRGSDADHSFWLDCAIRMQGPAVADAEALFLRTWGDGDGNGPLRIAAAASSPVRNGQAVRVVGSAPGERRPLFNRAIRRAIRDARTSITLATGYFVPARREWRLLRRAARRGVWVRLLLPGYSDVPAAVHAARALYGHLLRAGVEIHEVRDAMLHAKIATVDGVLCAIGSSNFDWRSVHFNNEVDAFVLGNLAAEADRMLDGWQRFARPVSLAEWEGRSVREHLLERVARLWKRLM
ncbi:phospholipase D-like domain-containing protein [Rhizosaccharibacter radicis]|uniref:Phospholipase D n=1 Tax=Rhizosaccharibacter radicis TaxID=2782605 RepID=A0ABT1VXA6_9PROT|nr:phospholipase D-like domain-containing protein [Acetobacteraceae bacterium KSS12]